MATATVAGRTVSPQAQFTRQPAPIPTSNENQLMHLAARLADACVNPSYMPDLWAVYHNRFVEVLRTEGLPGKY
jgi:hypothetical protein